MNINGNPQKNSNMINTTYNGRKKLKKNDAKKSDAKMYETFMQVI